jgi:microcystin-dependent protein
MDYPKSVPNVGLVDGKFVDENTTTGQVGSLIPSAWGNAVTDELLNVIRAGGDEPAENDNDQLLAAIKAIVRDSIPPEKIRTTLAEYGITDAYTKSVTYTKAEIEALLKNMSALPVGAMVPFPKGTVPPGFLEVDGSVQSTATYPDLAAYLGTTFNTGGEGAGNFRLPDSRGEFFRGWDHGRGTDAGRAVGSNQLDALQNIQATWGDMPRGVGGTSVNATGAVVGTTISSNNGADGGNLPYGVFSFDASRVARTATETRPRNLAVMWCIKAWNAPINQGNVDVAALLPLAAQATEANQGTAKIATQGQMLAGADDSLIVTPKKLRWGFIISLATNGYIVFPSWLGGLVVQWGTSGAFSSTPLAVGFPMAFPNAAYSVVALNYLGATNVTPSQDAVASFGLSVSGISFRTYSGAVSNGVKYIAVGS